MKLTASDQIPEGYRIVWMPAHKGDGYPQVISEHQADKHLRFVNMCGCCGVSVAKVKFPGRTEWVDAQGYNRCEDGKYHRRGDRIAPYPAPSKPKRRRIDRAALSAEVERMLG